MSETRYHDFGRFIQAEAQNSLQTRLFETGVLEGNVLSVSVDHSRIQIGSGSVITTDGVVIVNSATRTILLTPQGSATIFTVAQYHTFDVQAGGRGSTYELIELDDGFGNPIFGESGDLPNPGVVLGWIRYPGGSIDFESYMLHEAPKMRILNTSVTARIDPIEATMLSLETRAPLLDSPGCLLVLDVNVTATHGLDGTERLLTTWTNNHGAVAHTTAIYLEPQGPAVYRPKYVLLRGLSLAHISTSATVSIVVDGVETLLTTIIGAILVDGNQQILVPDNLFLGSPEALGTEWQIRVTFSINPMSTVSLRGVAVYSGPIPFAP